MDLIPLEDEDREHRERNLKVDETDEHMLQHPPQVSLSRGTQRTIGVGGRGAGVSQR